jgi:hypothetical protein
VTVSVFVIAPPESVTVNVVAEVPLDGETANLVELLTTVNVPL